MSGLRSQVSGLMERINLQADVSAAVEKECAALRSTVRTSTKNKMNFNHDTYMCRKLNVLVYGEGRNNCFSYRAQTTLFHRMQREPLST